MANVQTTYDLIVVARAFNKITGKISRDEAVRILSEMPISDKAFTFVRQAIDLNFNNEFEKYFRTDGIVAHLQVALATVGVKDFEW